MNEGHSALLTLELLRRYAYPPEALAPGEPLYDVPRVRELCNFTTHTPVEAGHDQFSYDLVAAGARRLLRRVDPEGGSAGQDRLNMTRLALNLSEYVNGVAKRHAEISRRLFPGYQVRAITNGVHPLTWTQPGFVAALRHVPAGLVPRAGAAGARRPHARRGGLGRRTLQAKQPAASSWCRRSTGVALDPDVPILGFARRMTAYKRPDLLFSRPRAPAGDRARGARSRSCSPARRIRATRAASS